MGHFFETIRQVWHTPHIRRRIVFTLVIIVIFRLVAHIPVPGANLENLAIILERNQLLGVFSVLTGGSVEQFSVILMGLSPYITASIIIQLLTVVIPSFEALGKEGEQGRRQLNQYSRYLTVPFAFLQSYGVILLLNSGQYSSVPLRVISDTSLANIMFVMIVIVTGTMFLMWLGELISEYGIGNGISVLIFAGIVSSIPSILGPTLSLAREDPTYLFPTVGIGLFTVLLIALIVYIVEGQRQIPITYAGRQLGSSRGGTSHLPIRVNQAGMIPIIFAVSMISFPGLLASFFQNAQTPWLRNLANILITQFQSTGGWYVVFFFILVVAFTFFYVNLTFRPDQIAENVQKRGGYVSGIRPGRETADYLRAVSNRLTLLGAAFLGFVAVLPIIAQNITTQFGAGGAPLLVSGAGLIIIVGVVLEIVRQVKAQLVMHNYDKMY